MSNPEAVDTAVGFIGVAPVSSVTTSDVVESPHDVLFNQGGTMNGEHFDSFADIFASMGCTIIDSSDGGYTNPLEQKGYENTLTGKQKKKRKASNKSERQRRKRGRK